MSAATESDLQAHGAAVLDPRLLAACRRCKQAIAFSVVIHVAAALGMLLLLAPGVDTVRLRREAKLDVATRRVEGDPGIGFAFAEGESSARTVATGALTFRAKTVVDCTTQRRQLVVRDGAAVQE